MKQVVKNAGARVRGRGRLKEPLPPFSLVLNRTFGSSLAALNPLDTHFLIYRRKKRKTQRGINRMIGRERDREYRERERERE
jgi:hypothetical protein